MENQYLSPEQVAALLDVKVGTLAAWRCQKRGPAFYRLNAVIRYKREDVDAWVEAQRVATATPAPRPVPAPLQQPNPLPTWLQNTRTKAQITGGC